MWHGYRGTVRLVLPSTGETMELQLFGRLRDHEGNLRLDRWGFGKQNDSRFQKLLSKGWKVMDRKELVGPGVAGEEEKKNTDKVDGSTKTGNQSHGGDHASCEVENSPNAARRGKRAGKNRRKRDQKKEWESVQEVKDALQHSGGLCPVYSPRPVRVTDETKESAAKSARLLAEFVGRSEQKIERGVEVDVEELLCALEIGDNPLPPLESPAERTKLKIMVSPDCSGSTQNWNGLGQAWALHLAGLPDVEVYYFKNANGEFTEHAAAAHKILKEVDFLIYLGDADGLGLCYEYAANGAQVLGFDTYASWRQKPRLRIEHKGKGSIYWVDRVSAHEPMTWYEGLKLCLKKK